MTPPVPVPSTVFAFVSLPVSIAVSVPVARLVALGGPFAMMMVVSVFPLAACFLVLSGALPLRFLGS